MTMAIKIMATGDDGVARGVTGKTPKRRHTTSLGHFVCFFFSFSFIFILLTLFIRYRSLTFATCFDGDSHQHDDEEEQ